MKKTAILLALACAGCPESSPTEPPPTGEVPTGEPPPTGTCGLFSELDLSVAQTLEGDCYVLDGGYTATAAIQIAAGTQITADPGAWLTIGVGGSLDVAGTAEAPVVFAGPDATPSTWYGLSFEGSNSASNQLRGLVIDGACSAGWNGASDSPGALFVQNSRLAVDGLTITNCERTGVLVWDRSPNVTLSNVTVDGADIGVWLAMDQAVQLGDGIEILGADTTVHIRDGRFQATGTLPAYVYTADDFITVNGDLTIAAGTSIRFDQGLGLDVDGGSLSAVGTEDAPIELVGVEQASATWYGVHFYDTLSTANRLEHVHVRHGGSAQWHGGDRSRGGIYLEGSGVRVQIVDSEITDCGGPALVADATLWESRIQISGTRFAGCASGPRVSPEVAAGIADDVVIEDNTTNTLRIAAMAPGTSTIHESITWPAPGVPLEVEDIVYVDGGLTIQPGTTVQFRDNTGLSADGGTMQIGSLTGAQVTLTGTSAVSGFWRGLSFANTAAGNTIYNTRLEYAGSTGWHGGAYSRAGLHIDGGATVDVEDLIIADTAYQDVFVENGGTLTGCAGLVGDVDGQASAVFCTGS